MDVSLNKFDQAWKSKWSAHGPFAQTLQQDIPDRWVRFHTLPESKRYPETDAEYRTALSRHNTILSELCSDENVMLITSQWSDKSSDPKLVTNIIDPSSKLWFSKVEDPDETDPEFFSYRYVYVGQRHWSHGVFDDILKAVADDEIGGVFFAPSDARWLYHPYDGGMDVFCISTTQRDELKSRHQDWLSSRSEGL